MRRLLPLLALAACARADDMPAPPAETIRYETSGCYGRCPAYVVTVSSNGRGWFEGRAFAAEAGLHVFGVTPAEFAEFRRRLAPWRPWRFRALTPGHECQPGAVAGPIVDVTWSGGSAARLIFDHGCRPARNRRMAAALRDAPDALPLLWLVARDGLSGSSIPS